MTKRLTSIRLPELTDRQLTELASVTGLNTTELLTTAIDRMYQQEIKTMKNQTTYHINAEMLGNDATDDEARRMVELLSERGYNVAYGEGKRHYDDAPEYKDWNECLTIINNERATN